MATQVKRDIWSFGWEIKRLDLAETVETLYKAALRTSSRQTHGTGQRAYHKFVNGINRMEALLPFQARRLARTKLYLASYIAFVILKPTIKRASLILS